MAEASPGRLPFRELVDFFRGKLNLPTARWDDIVNGAHDRAFIVAGAQKADLLQDLRAAVDGAIADGKSIQWFRERFDEAVERHGWSYTGPRDWRTRVIYKTNMATSYAAGRYEQLQFFDYWRYKHSDAVQHPRPLHVSWDGLVLPKNHPWWDTHFPPNGWGCQCRAIAASPGEYRDAPLKTAPNDGTYEKVDRFGVRHVIPNGIDYGFAYQPGARKHASFSSLLSEKLVRWDADLGAAAAADMRATLNRVLAKEFPAWVGEVLADNVSRGRWQIAGVMDPREVSFLTKEGAAPVSAEIAIEDRLLIGAKGRRHELAGDALTTQQWESLAESLGEPLAVLYDPRNGKLLYVLPEASSRRPQMVVELGYTTKKPKREVNMIVGAYRQRLENLQADLRGGLVKLVRGALE